MAGWQPCLREHQVPPAPKAGPAWSLLPPRGVSVGRVGSGRGCRWSCSTAVTPLRWLLFLHGAQASVHPLGLRQCLPAPFLPCQPANTKDFVFTAWEYNKIHCYFPGRSPSVGNNSRFTWDQSFFPSSKKNSCDWMSSGVAGRPVPTMRATGHPENLQDLGSLDPFKIPSGSRSLDLALWDFLVWSRCS